MSNFVGFKLSEEHDAALLKLAGERQAATGERVDKSVLLREAVAAYLVAQSPSGGYELVLVNIVKMAARGSITIEQGKGAVVGALRMAIQAALDSWTKDDDDAT